MSQPDPTPNALPAVWDLVRADMDARDRLGEQRYGVRLQPFNGRDALRDAYEESLDKVAYLRQAIYERDNPKSAPAITPVLVTTHVSHEAECKRLQNLVGELQAAILLIFLANLFIGLPLLIFLLRAVL